MTKLKVRGDAKELAEAIGIAGSVAPAKSPQPVLQNLLLDAHDGMLEVIGTDLGVTVRVRVERVDVVSDGRALVNAARLRAVLRKLAGEQVGIETDGRAGCVVSTSDSRFYGDSRFYVMGGELDDFPELPSWNGEVAFQLPAPELVAMIRRTEFAADMEKTSYARNWILIDVKDTRLRLVATDGARLAMSERPAPEVIRIPVFVIVPIKAMRQLARVIAGNKEHVEVSVEPTRIQFRTASATVTADLADGRFPSYEDILRSLTGYDKKILVPRKELLTALHRVAPRRRRVASRRQRTEEGVRFSFTREGLEITARVPEGGESRVQFPLDYPYDDLTIGFNPAFFVDALKVLTAAEFRMELKDECSAAMIQEQDEDGGQFVYLVMPMNLGA